MKFVLRVSHLSLYFQQRALFQDRFLSLKKGEKVFLHGESGCGISSFFDTIVGLEDKDLKKKGTILFKGGPLTLKSPVFYIPEHLPLFSHLMVSEVAFLMCYRFGMMKAFFDAPFGKDFSVKRHQIFSSLSGGEQRLLMLMLAFFIRPTFLIADKPLKGIAEKKHDFILKTLSDVKSMTVLASFLPAASSFKSLDFSSLSSVI